MVLTGLETVASIGAMSSIGTNCAMQIPETVLNIFDRLYHWGKRLFKNTVLISMSQMPDIFSAIMLYIAPESKKFKSTYGVTLQRKFIQKVEQTSSQPLALTSEAREPYVYRIPAQDNYMDIYDRTGNHVCTLYTESTRYDFCFELIYSRNEAKTRGFEAWLKSMFVIAGVSQHTWHTFFTTEDAHNDDFLDTYQRRLAESSHVDWFIRGDWCYVQMNAHTSLKINNNRFFTTKIVIVFTHYKFGLYK